jgi:hypothetical protein
MIQLESEESLHKTPHFISEDFELEGSKVEPEKQMHCPVSSRIRRKPHHLVISGNGYYTKLAQCLELTRCPMDTRRVTELMS